MSTQWQTHQERSTPAALKAIRWIALNLGRSVARLILYPITGYFLLFAPKQRRASFLYLQRVLPKKPTWFEVAKHIHCFAATILDRVYLMTAQFDKLSIAFPPENLPVTYSRDGRGCLLLGSHVGSFEVLRSYSVKKCPLPIRVLMYERQTPMIIQILNALNPEVANTLIPLDGSPNSLIKVKEAIDNGCVVGMLGDRVMSKEREKTVTCLFFGEEIAVPSAPILIAASLKVPLIVFFGLYHGGNRYQIHFELLAEQITLRSGSQRQQDIQAWMQRYVAILEQQVRAAPYNWFNFYDYWQDDANTP
jgi:predicted LPLAT superfamily acyltransferase